MLRECIAVSSGLTTATTAYTSGDQMGNALTFSGAATVVGGSGVILGAVAVDESAVLGAFDLVLFAAAPIGAGDNNPATFGATIARTSEGVISFAAANLVNIGANIVGTVLPVSGGQPFSLANSLLTVPTADLSGILIARTANAVFAGGATSVRIKLLIQDM